MIDVLQELRSVNAGGGLGYAAHAALDHAIEEIAHLRHQRDELQARGSQFVQQVRDLKAIIGGHPVVRVKRVGSPDLPLPRYETEGAAGMDLRADLSSMDRASLTPSGRLQLQRCERALIKCGFAFRIPEGFEGQVRGRSGLTKRGALIQSAIGVDGSFWPTGTIDSDYTGEVAVYLWNLGDVQIDIEHSDRVAQMIIAPAPQARLEEVDDLGITARGANGFGSTGVK